jgi:hypothetical protein
LINQDLIGSHCKTPKPVGYNDHNIGLVLTTKHQGRLDTSITNNQQPTTSNQQPTHDKSTSFAKKQILGRKKKSAGDSTELQNRLETSCTCRQYLKQKKNTEK